MIYEVRKLFNKSIYIYIYKTRSRREYRLLYLDSPFEKGNTRISPREDIARKINLKKKEKGKHYAALYTYCNVVPSRNTPPFSIVVVSINGANYITRGAHESAPTSIFTTFDSGSVHENDAHIPRTCRRGERFFNHLNFRGGKNRFVPFLF